MPRYYPEPTQLLIADQEVRGFVGRQAVQVDQGIQIRSGGSYVAVSIAEGREVITDSLCTHDNNVLIIRKVLAIVGRIVRVTSLEASAIDPEKYGFSSLFSLRFSPNVECKTVLANGVPKLGKFCK